MYCIFDAERDTDNKPDLSAVGHGHQTMDYLTWDTDPEQRTI